MSGARALVFGVVLWAGASVAETRTYVLAIGNNAPPIDAEAESLTPLRYADDDAADFFAFTRRFSSEAILLTVLDASSQQRFPELAEVARPPTLAELKRAVTVLRARIADDAREGRESVLLFFFSGHGTRGGARPPSLALLDAPLTQQVLYEQVLAELPARYVHLLVDACHAEAVVRPRDVSAQPVDVTDEDVQSYAARETLMRFPQVGAVLATAAGVESHEWDGYQRGVFSHELLSALRGAADVDRDGKVEYSELSAFLGAANREVLDPRARLSVVVHPPALNRRAPLVDLTRSPGTFRLVGRSSFGDVFVEDELGNRLADFNTEPGHAITLALPAERTLFVRHQKGEAPLSAKEGATVSLEKLRFAEPTTAGRGALDSSLRRGLFATSFGPSYYRGHVDQNQELAPVPLPDAIDDVTHATLDLDLSPPPAPARAGWVLLGTAGALVVAAAVLGGLGADAEARFSAETFQRPASALRDRAIGFETAALAMAGAAVVASGLGIWFVVRSPHHAVELSLSPTGPGLVARLGW